LAEKGLLGPGFGFVGEGDLWSVAGCGVFGD
jgi:hypothetical protein